MKTNFQIFRTLFIGVLFEVKKFKFILFLSYSHLVVKGLDSFVPRFSNPGIKSAYCWSRKLNFMYSESDFHTRQHGLFRWTQSCFFMMKIQVDYWAEIGLLFISIHFPTSTISTFYSRGTKTGDKRIKAFWTKNFNYLSFHQ